MDSADVQDQIYTVPLNIMELTSPAPPRLLLCVMGDSSNQDTETESRGSSEMSHKSSLGNERHELLGQTQEIQAI